MSLDGNDTGYARNLWQCLTETSTSARQVLYDCAHDNDGVLAPDKFVDTDAVKYQLNEASTSIDNKMEAIFGLAVDFYDSQIASSIPASGPLSITQFQLQVDEFLEQIIEAVRSLPWLLVRMPPQCGEHLWMLYRERVEQLLTTVERCESIFWAVRRGFGQLPRRRDFSSLHLFRSLPLSALEDAQKRWDVHLEHLRDACEEVKALLRPKSLEGQRRSSATSNDSIPEESINIQFSGNENDNNNTASDLDSSLSHGTDDLDLVKKIVPACKLIHTVFKKIKLRCLGGFNGESSGNDIHYPFSSLILGDGNPSSSHDGDLGADADVVGDSQPPSAIPSIMHPYAKPANPRRTLIDDLLDAADPIPLLVVDIAALFACHPYNVSFLCERLAESVRAAQKLIDLVKTWMEGEHLRWFEVAARQLDSFLLPLIEINPPR